MSLHHYRSGKCSGFRTCCIVFFWLRLKALLYFKSGKSDRIANLCERFVDWCEGWLPDWGYVTCPLCVLLNRRVKVKECKLRTCTCGGAKKELRWRVTNQWWPNHREHRFKR